MTRPHRTHEAGQALVIMAIAIVAVIAGVGLIIDGGNAWAQQRISQNGNDASAEAGAVVLASYLSNAAAPPSGWDGAVETAVLDAADRNGIDVEIAYYTDICGTLLRTDGTKAATPADAAVVGDGTLPTNNHTNPDCPSGVVGPVAGVQVNASKAFDTFVSRVIGISSLKASTTATAVSGLLQGCTVDTGCIVLPVTAPTVVVTCDGHGDAVLTPTEWPMNTRVIIPLCKGNPGNVGWIDWTPKAGGTSELVDNILHPNNPPIDLPSWQYVTETGDQHVRRPGRPVSDVRPDVRLRSGLRAGQGRSRLWLQRHRRQRVEPVVPDPPVRGVPPRACLHQRQRQATLRHRERCDQLPDRAVRELHHDRDSRTGDRRRDDRRRHHRDTADQVVGASPTTGAEGTQPSALRFHPRYPDGPGAGPGPVPGTRTGTGASAHPCKLP
jgi:hypothetical protein